MSWVRLEDTFPEHPKLLTVGGDAGWLHVCAIAYCSRNLTDGFIPAAAVRQISDRKQPLKLAQALVDAGIWAVSQKSHEGFEIHDYLEYHPTRADVEAQRAQRSEVKAKAGHLGGIASGVARRKHKRSTTEAEGQANTNQNEAPTRPDPYVQVSDNSTPVDTPFDGGGDVQQRINDIAEHYARAAVDARAIPPTNADAYKRQARQTARGHVELGTYLEQYPTAAPEHIALWLLGKTETMRLYSAKPVVVKEAWYADPQCTDCNGDGWKTVDGGYVEACNCRQPDPYIATVHQLNGRTQ